MISNSYNHRFYLYLAH